jgi:hypothetical protein
MRLGVMLRLNAERFSPDPDAAEAERGEGYALYEEKPTLRKGNVQRVAADGETHTVGFCFLQGGVCFSLYCSPTCIR